MNYYSSNRHVDACFINPFTHPVAFKDALFMGQAPDKGLFMPENIPVFTEMELHTLSKLPYPLLAAEVIYPFVKENINKVDLEEICKKAYTFSIPVENYKSNIVIARMDQGPSASFKDFAAQWLSNVFDHLKPKDKKYSILVSTSGDTGGAIASAFEGKNNINVCILYPEKEVSSEQKKQLNSFNKNVISIEVAGKFDDCQDLVKKAFSDPELSDLNFTSANSINIGRVLPQIVYYFYLFFKVSKNFEPVVFSIPTGNLGNALGCEIARRMGLPVDKIILACNENDQLENFLNNGNYTKTEPSKNCISNAMNVGNPSNLARFYYLYNGALNKEGVTYRVPDIEYMRKNLRAYSINDSTVKEVIRKTYREKFLLLEPHGATGVAAIEKYAEKNIFNAAVVLETAHPSKFKKELKEILKDKINFQLQHDEGNEARFKIKNNYAELKQLLINQSNG